MSNQTRGTGTIAARLTEDMKEAMRSGDTVSRDTLRYLLAGLKNATIANGGTLDEDGERASLSRQAKQFRQSIEQFEAAGRDDLAGREKGQLQVLERYLPAGIDDDALRTLVTAVADEVGATGPKDMKSVMPVALERAGEGADGRRVNAIVREILAARS
ncbi:MAG: GatB/YqeY domain-containing protein [Chloroflexia bacterium]|nr:GatB/YqeY domain-containing protein [Chloroflexia bacterium]